MRFLECSSVILDRLKIANGLFALLVKRRKLLLIFLESRIIFPFVLDYLSRFSRVFMRINITSDLGFSKFEEFDTIQRAITR